MKRLLLTVLCFCGLLQCYGQKKLVLHQTNGTNVSIGFDEKPVLSVYVNGVRLATSTYDVCYENNQVKSFEIVDTNTGINDIAEHTKPSLSNGQISVDNAKSGTEVMVYSTQGMLVSKVAADENGHANVNLSSLPTGVYVVKVGNNSYKFMKR